MISRGIRNNNPGNLVITKNAWKGKVSHNTDGHFEQFTHMYFGVRAMIKNLLTQYSRGQNTISKMIAVYAPPHENNTKNYIDFVAKSVGINANERFDIDNNEVLNQIVRAIIKMENGKDADKVSDSDISKAFSELGRNLVTVVSGNKNTILNKVLPVFLAVVVFFYTIVIVKI